MKKMIKRVVKTAIIFGFVFALAFPAYGETKEEVNKKIQELRNQQEQLKDELAELRTNKADTEAYIAELDTQIRGVMTKIAVKEDEIASKEKQIIAKEAEIRRTQKDLNEAKRVEKSQYDSLRSRIQIMYESGSTSQAQKYLELLVTAEDLSKVFNERKYVSEISDYDQKLLVEYQ